MSIPTRLSVFSGRLSLATLLVAVLALAATPALASSGAAGSSRCYGAAAMAHSGCKPTRSGPLAQSLSWLTHDRSDAYDLRPDGKDCWSHAPDFTMRWCGFGSTKGHYKVILLGNSHAGEWLPALQRIGAPRHWRIATYLASACASADLRQNFDDPAVDARCRAWVKSAVAHIVRSHTDLVVMANRVSRAAPGHTVKGSGPLYRAGYRTVLRQLVRAGIRVVVLRDTPAPGDGGISVAPCLAHHPGRYDRCSGPKSVLLPKDPTLGAAYDLHSRLVRTIDLTDRLCYRTTCWITVGGVIVYFDGSHMSATYARTLAPYLAPPLLKFAGRKAR